MNPMNAILNDKLQLRKKLAALPYEEKVEMVKQMRVRSQELESNPLRQPFISSVVVSGGRLDSVTIGARSKEWTPLASRQSQDQQHIHQASETVLVTLSKQNGQWGSTPLGDIGSKSEPQNLGRLIVHRRPQKKS